MFQHKMVLVLILLPLGLLVILPTCYSIQISKDHSYYTHVQESNIYCSKTIQPKGLTKQQSQKISCNFNYTAARLSSVKFLGAGKIAAPKPQLHLRIENCSILWITSEFLSEWRTQYSSLSLQIENVEDVVQEQMIDIQNLNSTFLHSSDLISFVMRNSSMANLYPSLVSDTRTLLFEISNCCLRVISAHSFRNVDKTQLMKILNSNISHIERHAMPQQSLLSQTEHHNPFIFNETRIGLIETYAMHFSISGEYFNIINSHFSDVRAHAITITGRAACHVLFADSVFAYTEDNAINVQLQNNDQTSKIYAHSLSRPTVTFMGLDFHTANISSLLSSMKLPGGKLFLLRLTFRASFESKELIRAAESWRDINQSTVIERWNIMCNCNDNLYDILHAYIKQQHESGMSVDSSEDSDVFDSLLTSEDYNKNYYLYQDETESKNLEESKFTIKELKCIVEDLKLLEIKKFKTLHCPLTFPIEVERNAIHVKISSILKNWWWIYVGATGLFIFLTSWAILWLVKYRKRGTFATEHKSLQHLKTNHAAKMNNSTFTTNENIEECTL